MDKKKQYEEHRKAEFEKAAKDWGALTAGKDEWLESEQEARFDALLRKCLHLPYTK